MKIRTNSHKALTLGALVAVAAISAAGCSNHTAIPSVNGATPPVVVQSAQDNAAKQAAWIQAHPGEMQHAAQ